MKDSRVLHNYITDCNNGITINRTRGLNGIEIYDNVVVDNLNYGIYAMDDDLDIGALQGTAKVYHNIFWSNVVEEGYDALLDTGGVQ